MNKSPFYSLVGWGFSNELGLVLPTIQRPKPLAYENLSYDDLPDLAYQLRQALVQPGYLVALSFGGLIALELARQFPDKVKGLILIASQPKWVEEAGWSGINQLKALAFYQHYQEAPKEALAEFYRWVAYPRSSCPELAKYQRPPSACLGQQLSDLLTLDYRKVYCQLEIPIYHLMPLQDLLLPFNPTQLQRLNSRAIVQCLPQMGHGGIFESWLKRSTAQCQ